MADPKQTSIPGTEPAKPRNIWDWLCLVRKHVIDNLGDGVAGDVDAVMIKNLTALKSSYVKMGLSAEVCGDSLLCKIRKS